MFRRAEFWLGVLISLICLTAVLWVVDLEQVLESLRTADWRAALVIAAGQTAFLLLRGWRWKLMLGGGARYGPLFHAQNIGYLITNLVPFRLGDVARSYLAGQEPEVSGVQALSSVVLERVLDMLIIVLFFGVAAPLAPALPEVMGVTGALISAAAVAGFLLMLLAAAKRQRALQLARSSLGRVGFLRANADAWLARISSVLDGFKVLTQWGLLLRVVMLSLALWLCILAGYYGGLRGFWPEATWAAALFTLCAAAFGVAAPSTPGFVGVFHGAVMIGLSVFPATEEQALSFAAVYHAVMFLVILVLGLLGLWQTGRSLGSILAAVRGETSAAG